jgi:cullin 1
LRLVERQRNGNMIPEDLVKKVLDSFVSVGLDESDTTKQSLEVYEEHFEKPFIDAADRYYKQASEVFLAENNFSDYLKEVAEIFRKEEARAGQKVRAGPHPRTL